MRMPPSRARRRRSAVVVPLQRADVLTSGPPSFPCAMAGTAATAMQIRRIGRMRATQAVSVVSAVRATGHWSQSPRSLPAELASQPVPLDPEDRLHAIVDADRAEDAREVRLHRLLADLEPPRDQLVRHPVEQQAEHLALSRRDRGK